MDPSFNAGGSLAAARYAHTATLLPNGKVLIAGGVGAAGGALNSAELYDPASGTFSATTGPLSSPRRDHTATLLPNGKVLIAGGSADGSPITNGTRSPGGSALNSAELYDPTSGTFSATTGLLGTARYGNTATLLPNGKVLIAGGYGTAGYLLSAELYDPASRTFSATTGSMSTARLSHTATLLPNGKVLIAGGADTAGSALNSAELYNPANGTFTATTGPPSSPRRNHTATLLPNGKVLIAGGRTGSAGVVRSAELYNPASGTFSSTGSLTNPRQDQTATLLPNGKVLIAAGFNNTSESGGLEMGSLTLADLYDPADGTFDQTATRLATGRDFHTATLLPDGRVLNVGGDDNNETLSSAELYNPPGGTFSPTTEPLAKGRFFHAATLLPTGMVLIAGGCVPAAGGPCPGASSSAELYDPASGTFSATTGSLVAGRYSPTATLLPDGKVLIAGGGLPGNVNGAALNSAELFNPTTGTFSATTGSLTTARQDHTATLLPNGEILIVGGHDGNFTFSSAELYNPTTGTFSSTTGPMATARYSHTATLLTNGKVLIAGGATNSHALPSAELYNPTTGTFSATAGPMATARYSHTATLLTSGKVLITGGRDAGPLTLAELYDPASSTFSPTIGPLASARYFHTATVLPNGGVLIAGGLNGVGYLNSGELYDPVSRTFSATEPFASARYSHTATLLPNGKILIAAGYGGGSVQSSAELFASDTSDPARRPSIAPGSSTTIRFGTPFMITGSLFGGGSEASGGTTSSSSTSYPLVSLLSVEGGQFHWLVPDSRCAVPATCNFWDDPMAVTVSDLPSALNPGWHLVTVITNGVPSVSEVVQMICGPPAIPPAGQPANVTTTIGTSATFSVAAQGGRTFQWRQDGLNIPGATAPSYTTPPITGSDSGSRFDVVIGGSCGSVTSEPAVVTVADSTPPTASLVAPTGGEYWLLSTAGNPASTRVVTWSMSDNVRVCSVVTSLLYSDDGGANYTPTASNGGVLGTFGSGGSCVYPGESTTSLTYTIPTAFPSAHSGSLYKIQVAVTDQAGNATTVTSPNPFYIVQANPDSVKTLILSNVTRMITRSGISSVQGAQINGKLQELANHPRVQGLVVDLNSVTAITNLYSAWDGDNTGDPTKANDVLFGVNGIHDYLKTNVLPAYSGVKYVVIVGDDRIIPMARMQDHTALLPESRYPDGGDISPTLTTVGQALAGGKYLTDDPLAVMDTVSTNQLDGNLFLPDLSVGRLVETPPQIIGTIARYISQDGVLDLSLLNATTGHKVLITGYDFLANVSTQMRARWKSALGVATADGSPAPVDGSLIGGNWALGSVAARTDALRTRLSGNGGLRYGIMGIAGHATHYEEGVPGTDPLDIEGLSTADIFGADSCATPSLGALDLSGGVAYAVGCHGGLSVPGSCRTDVNHSLDLPETMLGRGAVAYVANSGYGWGLRYGIGYGARLTQILTEQMTAGGTIAVGDAVRQSKQRYYLETPRYDPYDEKSLMEWTLYGLPMYAVKTGIEAGALSVKPSVAQSTGPARVEQLGSVRVRRLLAGQEADSISASGGRLHAVTSALPPSLTQLSLSFDFTASGVFQKHDSSGTLLSPGLGCPDINGCYYTLNGLVDRGTGSGDLPIQPYLIYDSRLSGSSQHGVLWKGGSYDEEAGWIPVIAQLVSNGGDGSNHGSSPRTESIRPTSPRVVPGIDSPTCRPSDLEVNGLIVAAGEAVKNQTTDLTYSIARRYRNIDLEVYYFNNQGTPIQNCDRSGPALGAGPYSGEYHQRLGSTLNWAVPATDASGVWRVVVVYNPNTVNGQSRGMWTPLDLTDDGSGVFRGSIPVGGVARMTYVIQAVDNRGNITWLDYVSTQLPSSGVPLGLPRTVDVTDAPTGVLATATTATSVAVSWESFAGAASYDVYRSATGTSYSKIGSSGSTNYADNTAAPNTAYLYAVKAVDAGNAASPLSYADLATTVIFADPNLATGSTAIKATHVTELRTAVNAVRALAGFGAYSFIDPVITAGTTTVKVAHIADLRAALSAARATLNLTTLVYIDASLTATSSVIKVAHINDLRNGVR